MFTALQFDAVFIAPTLERPAPAEDPRQPPAEAISALTCGGSTDISSVAGIENMPFASDSARSRDMSQSRIVIN
jgi:hypothetical protein